MIWLALLKRYWPLLPLALALGFLVYLMHRVDVLTSQRDKYQVSSLQWQQSSQEWQASFREAEKLRKAEQGAAVGAINASEASCEARIAQARSSAVKIERIVTKEAVCAPGSSPVYSLVDPRSLSDALSAR